MHVAYRYPAVSATIHNNLGNSYYGRGQFDDAIAQYNQGIQVNSRVPSLYDNLGKSYEKLGNIEQSLAVYNEGVVNNLESPWVFVQAGDAYYRQQNTTVLINITIVH